MLQMSEIFVQPQHEVCEQHSSHRRALGIGGRLHHCPGTALGISRNALAHACKVGRLERIAHGAYRLSGAPSSETDELGAIWKLTASTAFSWERQAKWDGVAVGGSTAAWLLGIGDFHLSPYRIYAPERINSKIESARFGVRNVDEGDMTWMGRTACHPRRENACRSVSRLRGPVSCRRRLPRRRGPRPHRLCEAWQPARRARRKQTASGPARAPRKSPLRIRPERPIMKSLFLIKQMHH